jgi:hypothetical protein
LGQSPIHNRNVALVLHRHTGHVSPQFHIKFDKAFDSLRQEELTTTWQIKTGFTNESSQGKNKRNASSEGAMDAPALTQQKSPRTYHTSPGSQVATQLPVPPDDHNAATAKALGEGPPQEKAAQNATSTGQNTDTRRSGQDGALPTRSSLRVTTTRSGRSTTPSQRLIEVMMAEAQENTIPGEIFCSQTLFPRDDCNNIDPLLVYKTAVSNPDSMYYHEAMQQPDKDYFIEGMQKEMDRQLEDGNFTIVHRKDIPKDVKIFRGVWQMRRKRDIKTMKIKTHKSRLAFDGSMMEHGKHYDQTYSPVASWSSIRLILSLVATHKWHTAQIDYVLAYPQAAAERELYMEIPRGCELDGNKSKKDYALRINANLYGQKQAGRVWFLHLAKRLVEHCGFTQSKIDECIFYRGNVIYVLYIDDSLIVGPDQKEIDQVIQDIRAAKLNITVEGTIKDFIGVNIQRNKDDTITFSQPQLIQKVLKALRMEIGKVKSKSIPAASSRILKRHSASPPFDQSFHYRSVIGMMNYLDAGSRSDIAYATHQCARFSSDPKKEHGDAVRWIGRYLAGTHDKGMTFTPNVDAGLEVFVDADFAGNWDTDEAWEDRDTARSRHGYLVRYSGCNILWKSQLQTEIALSSTESEYTGLSYALRAVIPLMRLLEEMKGLGFPISKTTSDIHCKVFEDNSGALEMARVHKFRPRTKHINVKLHHFRSYVEKGKISIHAISSEEQLADYLTKPLPEDKLVKLRKQVLGW